MKKIAIVGGGIVGLATAYKVQKLMPTAKVTLFEKEDSVGLHQSGRNSGVLHCGLYYEPGSLKSRLAVSGIRQMTEFCIENQIPHDICGKIVVASNSREEIYLDNLADRGSKNGLQGLKYLSNQEMKSREPYVFAKKALLVPEEGIVDYKIVMQKLSENIKLNNGEIILSTKIENAKNSIKSVILFGDSKDWEFDIVFNCAGLHSDRTYQKFTGNKRPLRIVPFRGEYLMLKEDARKLVNHLVYPVPDPDYPFLGVHFTRLVNGEREVGPNAVFAFKREGYKNTDFSFNDSIDSLTYKGFINFISKNLRFSLNELKSSIFMSSFLDKAKKLIPEIDSSMFVKGTSGVRAQAMDDKGKLLMDFNIIRDGNQIHVLNAPSPGATASLSIADYILKDYL
jgi:L-2-hydroxyglutarate oxidase